MRARLMSVVGVAALVCQSAAAQVIPTRTYYGIDRPVPVEVAVPEGSAGDVSVRLMNSESAELARASAEAGPADLAAMFEGFWSEESTRDEVRYAQLFVGDEAVGAAMVLQAMRTPELAYLTPQRELRWGGSARFVSGIRAYVEKHAVMETTEGDVTFRMRPDVAPNTVWNFLSLADGGYYTDVIFHRIIGERPGRAPFVIQAGDPRGEGVGGPGFFIDLERSTLPHTFGVLSMARSGDPNSNGSQVFICLSRAGTQGLDGSYTSFAEAVGGADAILAIESVEVGVNDRPTDPPVIERVRLVDAPARGTGPAPITRPASESGGR
ncbi:MAG: peptidylprolyl isomerase [Planctomycetota bacterium]